MKYAVFLIAAALFVPVAAANHGFTGTLVASLSDGSAASASLSYVTGNFNTQTWSFAWSTSGGANTNCFAFGSIEIGFTSLAGCSLPFSTGPTGDSHGFPYGQTDAHPITVNVNGVAGTGVQVICADSGNTAGPCNTVLGAL